jgi:hypothetical protein
MNAVGATTYDKLRKMSQGEIATYEQIIDVAEGKKVNIEIKSQGDANEDRMLADFIVTDIKTRRIEKDVLISSISKDLVKYIKTTYPELAVGQVFWIKASTYAHFDFLTNGLYREAVDSRADYLMLHIANALNELGLKYSDEREALQHITYANFFQRPAEKTGESIEVKPIDIRMATEIALLRVQDIQPDLMVFASKKAWNCSSDFREEVKQLPFLYVPHPSCPWWFRSSSRGRGIDQFQGFLNENKWYIP